MLEAIAALLAVIDRQALELKGARMAGWWNAPLHFAEGTDEVMFEGPCEEHDLGPLDWCYLSNMSSILNFDPRRLLRGRSSEITLYSDTMILRYRGLLRQNRSILANYTGVLRRCVDEYIRSGESPNMRAYPGYVDAVLAGMGYSAKAA